MDGQMSEWEGGREGDVLTDTLFKFSALLKEAYWLAPETVVWAQQLLSE